MNANNSFAAFACEKLFALPLVPLADWKLMTLFSRAHF